MISKRSLQRHISKEENACEPTLSPGYVITVEPGIYFIPELIDRWKAENKCASFIDYDAVEKYFDFGGIRIEDACLVTESGNPIHRTIEEVEQAAS